MAGIEADAYMKRGELVPDVLIAKMIEDLMAGIREPCTLLLDGFPRTVVQGEILDATIARCGATLASVVLLDVEESVLLHRIAGRRGCPKCGAGYHVTQIPPRIAGVCDVCGTGLITRKDDNPETVKNRLAVYQAQTLPLIEFYGARGVLRKVDGTGPLDQIIERVRQAVP